MDKREESSRRYVENLKRLAITNPRILKLYELHMAWCMATADTPPQEVFKEWSRQCALTRADFETLMDGVEG